MYYAGRSTTRIAGRPCGSSRLEPTAPRTSSKSRAGLASRSAPKMKRNVFGRPIPPPRSCHVGISICWRTALVARRMSPGRRPAASAFDPSPTAPTTTIGRPPASSDSCSITPHGTSTSNFISWAEPSERGSKKHSVSSTLQSGRAMGSTTESPGRAAGASVVASVAGAKSRSASAASRRSRAASANSDAASSPPGAARTLVLCAALIRGWSSALVECAAPSSASSQTGARMWSALHD
mmetsp:Transcript_16010/g.42204  ORF Transcript_16010/g.42204 Transcript_16010/m.42204 type:complete len:238 (-) Transcript_16010:544-1257(-)